MFKKILFVALLAGFLSFGLNFALAQSINQVQTNNATPGNNTGTAAVVQINNPLNVDSPQKLIGNVINALLGVIGSIALLMFIYGGFTWMTAAGNEKNVEKGQKILLWATIGLVIIFTSYALVRFLITGVIGA